MLLILAKNLNKTYVKIENMYWHLFELSYLLFNGIITIILI